MLFGSNYILVVDVRGKPVSVFVLVLVLLVFSPQTVNAVSTTVDSVLLTKSSYRQGEIVAFNYWVSGFPSSTDHIEVSVSLVDPSGFVVDQVSGLALKINASHYIYSGSFSLSDNAATGVWTLNGTSKSYDRRGKLLAEGSDTVRFTVTSKPSLQPIIVPINGNLVLPSTVYMMPDGRIDPFTIAFFVANSSDNSALSNVYYEVLITDPLNRTVAFYNGLSRSNGEVRVEGDTSILSMFGTHVITAKLRNSTLHVIDSCTDVLTFLPVTFPYSTYITGNDESRIMVAELKSGNHYFAHVNVSYLDPDRGFLTVTGHFQFRKTGGEGILNVTVYFSFIVCDAETEVWAFFEMPYGNYPDGKYQVICTTTYGFQVDFGTYEIDWEPAPQPAREIYIYPKVETAVTTPLLANIIPALTLLLGLILGIILMKLSERRLTVKL